MAITEQQNSTDDAISHINGSVVTNTQAIADHWEMLLDHNTSIRNNTEEIHYNKLHLKALAENITANREQNNAVHDELVGSIANNTQAISGHQEILTSHNISISSNAKEIRANALQLEALAENVTTVVEHNAEILKDYAAMLVV